MNDFTENLCILNPKVTRIFFYWEEQKVQIFVHKCCLPKQMCDWSTDAQKNYLGTATKYLYLLYFPPLPIRVVSSRVKSCQHPLSKFLFLVAAFVNTLLKHLILRTVDCECVPAHAAKHRILQPPPPKTQPRTCRRESISTLDFSSRQPINMEIKLLCILFCASPPLGESRLRLLTPLADSPACRL